MYNTDQQCRWIYNLACLLCLGFDPPFWVYSGFKEPKCFLRVKFKASILLGTSRSPSLIPLRNLASSRRQLFNLQWCMK